MKKTSMIACTLVAGAVLSPGSATAQETGLADMHSWVRIGGRTCMLDHYHDGSGSGPTRAAAQRAAIQAWIDFTAWEYGNRWGSWNASIAKRMSCSGSAGSYSCNVSSRPCRR